MAMTPTRECFPPATWGRKPRRTWTTTVPHASHTAHHVLTRYLFPTWEGIPAPLRLARVRPLRLMPARAEEMVTILMSLARVSWSRSPAPSRTHPLEEAFTQEVSVKLWAIAKLTPSKFHTYLPPAPQGDYEFCMSHQPHPRGEPHPHPCSHKGHGCHVLPSGLPRASRRTS